MAGRNDNSWGHPGIYAGALLLIGVMLGPVVYIIIGGFRTNAQITVDPAGLPHPWEFVNYTGVLSSSTTEDLVTPSPARRSPAPGPVSAARTPVHRVAAR